MKVKDLLSELHSLVSLHDGLDIKSAEINIRNNVPFRGMNVWILACAIVIASVGLNVNSTAVIIGAMLISPLMGPIIGFGLSLGTNDMPLLKSSLYNLAVMVAISITASTLFFLISPLNLQNQSELLARTNPTIYDVIVAFIGGAAGALENSRKDKGTVISGVAIATALMPPLCTVGYGLSIFDFNYVFGALYLFAINCIFVALATFVVVKFLHYPVYAEADPAQYRRMRTLASIILVVMVVPSVFSAVRIIEENNFSIRANKFVNAHKSIDGVLVYDYSINPQRDDPSITLHLAGRPLTFEEKTVLVSEARQLCHNENTRVLFNESSLTNAVEMDSEFEKQVYHDLNDQLKTLQDSIRIFHSRELPYEQLDKEMLALFPQVESIRLAKGNDNVIAIVQYRSTDSESISDQLQNWIKVRLSVDRIDVYDIYPQPQE